MAGGSRATEGNGRFAETASVTQRKAGRMTIRIITFDISDGPNADRVFDALKYAFNPDIVILVEFTVRRRDSRSSGPLSWQKVTAQVVDVGYESGRPGAFAIKVNIPGFDTSEGLYDANTRKGWLELVPSTRVNLSARR